MSISFTVYLAENSATLPHHDTRKSKISATMLDFLLGLFQFILGLIGFVMLLAVCAAGCLGVVAFFLWLSELGKPSKDPLEVVVARIKGAKRIRYLA
jgi:hypothetical protein